MSKDPPNPAGRSPLFGSGCKLCTTRRCICSYPRKRNAELARERTRTRLRFQKRTA
jgi:hypothetical protein